MLVLLLLACARRCAPLAAMPVRGAATPRRRCAPLAASFRGAATPHSGYHGQGAASPFFEGWYSRLTLPEAETSAAFIFAINDPLVRTARTGVEAQVLVSTPDGEASFVANTTDASRFAALPHALSLRCALGDEDAFAMTSTSHRGRVGGVAWDFAVEPVVGWGGPFADAEKRQYSTAGWLASLGPIFSPHYQVLQSLGRATGWIDVDGDRRDFSRAAFYAEKNWGAAFPSRWWWIQCNTFATVDGATEVTLTATGARRTLTLLGGGEEDVALVGLHVDGAFLPFPDVAWTVAPWGDWAVRGEYDGLVVEVRATCDDDGVPVRVPTPDGMRDGATETYRGALSLAVSRGAETILEASTTLACLETGGDYGGAAWGPAESAMAEPLRTIAFNLDLENAVSASLDAAQSRGWLDIPGL